MNSRQPAFSLAPMFSTTSGSRTSSFIPSTDSTTSPSSFGCVSARRSAVVCTISAERPKSISRSTPARDLDAEAFVSKINTMEQFWELADDEKLNAQYTADSKIEFLKHASADEVRKICIQYRYFVQGYPGNLISLVSKLPDGELKVLLAHILSEELGLGEEADVHLEWYDRFLRSIGITDEELENSEYPENAVLLKELADRCANKPYEHVIGVCGMAGECLCQIYLTNMEKYLIQNDFIKSINDKIDWHFWTYHIGDDDIEHRIRVRAAVNRMMTSPESIKHLAEGYHWGKSIFDTFWTNNYKETRAFQQN